MVFQRFCFLFLLLLMTTLVVGQDVIHLKNPSFEDEAHAGEAPINWQNCGLGIETPPDVHSATSHYFDVQQTPSHGKTFLGMVTRDNDTWEYVSQVLSTRLLADSIYLLEIDLCMAPIYKSVSRATGKEQNYSTPAKLRIWSGTGFCSKMELLAETSPIKNSEWKTYSIVLAPNIDVYLIIFEVFYLETNPFPTNGNILLDNCSPIIKISKDDYGEPKSKLPEVERSIEPEKMAISPDLDKISEKALEKQRRIITKEKAIEILKSKRVKDIDAYPILSTVDNVEEFFLHTDEYMMLSYFKKHSFGDMESLRLSMLEIGTEETASVLLDAMEIYYHEEEAVYLDSKTKKALSRLDDTIENAKAKDELWKKIEFFINENIDSLHEETSNYKL